MPRLWSSALNGFDHHPTRKNAHTTRLFTRAQSECQSHAQCGYGNDKKFRSSLFKGLRVQGSALGTYRHALSNGLFSPSLDQESSRNLSRGSRYGKRGSMPLFPYLSELVTFGLRSHWNYVGRHGADKFSTRYPRGLSGGQFTAGNTSVAQMPRLRPPTYRKRRRRACAPCLPTFQSPNQSSAVKKMCIRDSHIAAASIRDWKIVYASCI